MHREGGRDVVFWEGKDMREKEIGRKEQKQRRKDNIEGERGIWDEGCVDIGCR